MPGWVFVLAAVLFPPLGIVLVWAKSRAGAALKLLASLALVALSVFYLRALFGMRVEVDGTGYRPIVSLYIEVAEGSSMGETDVG